MKKQKRGTRTQDAIPDILDRVSRGESLVRACEANSLTHGAFLERVGKDPDLADRYARAKSAGLELLAEELVEIADNQSGDHNRDRLRVDTRKWLLAKLMPKKYGERATLEHTGRDGGPIESTATLAFKDVPNGKLAELLKHDE